MRRKWKRALSLLCTLAMIAGMLPVSSLAAAGPETAVSGGINGYAATMQADEVTSDGWRTAFEANGVSGAQEIDGTYRSSALNGKIWTDKSVSIGDNNDFDVTFSALGQTFAGQEVTSTEVAYDVMFVLDLSASMTNGQSSKGRNAVTAINSAMETLLLGEENRNNRVGIVTFSSGTARGMFGSSYYINNADEFLPLGHYTKQSAGWGGSADFLTYNEKRVTVQAVNSSTNREITASKSFDGGTFTEGGIIQAMDSLMEAEEPSDQIVRNPVIILVTDGDPTFYHRYQGNNPSFLETVLS